MPSYRCCLVMKGKSSNVLGGANCGRRDAYSGWWEAASQTSLRL